MVRIADELGRSVNGQLSACEAGDSVKPGAPQDLGNRKSAARATGDSPLFDSAFARMRGLLTETNPFLGLTPWALRYLLLRRLGTPEPTRADDLLQLIERQSADPSSPAEQLSLL